MKKLDVLESAARELDHRYRSSRHVRTHRFGGWFANGLFVDAGFLMLVPHVRQGGIFDEEILYPLAKSK